MTTEEMLVARFGVLLDLTQVAELLKRKSADSVRVAMSGNTGYSGPSCPLNPDHRAQPFRSIAPTHSGPSCPV